jgi:hypothetical protein
MIETKPAPENLKTEIISKAHNDIISTDEGEVKLTEEEWA